MGSIIMTNSSTLHTHQYTHIVGGKTYGFRDLKDLMAKATPARSGDILAGVADHSAEQRAVAQMALAELPLATFLNEALIPYEDDEITRLIIDSHDAAAFATVSHLTVGDFRNWLLGDDVDSAVLAALAPGITPEMAAAVSKIMRNQDLILVAQKCRVVTAFRNTIGLPAACRPACSRTILPTMPAASPPVSLMVCCMVAATRCSASIQPPTMCRK
ncbi:ethanolamine ammonia lyase large subunit family protein [Collimonas arenae]|nr:ethanolamine ammonia lyase large subunit family protein [Collimonas arenae]